MTLRFETVIFDFDYTLADSSQGATECIRYALERLGLPAVSHQRACQTIGLSLPETFHELTGRPKGEQSDSFAHLFVERAEAVMANGTVLYDAVPRTVRTLKAHGIDLGIVSTKYRRRIETILVREGLMDVFDIVVGGEDVLQHKPDPEGLHVAVAALGSRHPLYLGDSRTDAQTAQRAGVPFCGVLTGVTTREAFTDYDVVGFVNSLDELPGLIIPNVRRQTAPA
jgi:phosphoglycolate phosphatase